MEIKEIRQVAIQMQKLHRDGRFDDVSCLLQDLQTTEVTLEQLQNTDVVKIIHQLLKSCPVPTIQKRAKDLLLKWKHEYSLSNEPKSVNTSKTREHTAANVAESMPSSTQHTDQLINYSESINTEQEDPNEPSSKGATSSKDGRSTPEVNDLKTVLKKDDSQTALNSHPQSSSSQKDCNIRAKCVEFLHQALKLDQRTDTDLLINLAQAIEIQIYSLYGHDTSKYKSCIRSKIAYIKNPKSPHLRQGLLSGTLDPHTFAHMSAEEMASEELRRLRQGYTAAGINEHQLPQGLEGTTTTRVRCQRCESTDCRVTQISRGTLFLPSWVKRGSADEDAMTFMTCAVCGAQWYHNSWVCL